MANDDIPRGDAEFNGWLSLDTPRSPKANPSRGDGRASHNAASQGLANFVTYANANLAGLGPLGCRAGEAG